MFLSFIKTVWKIIKMSQVIPYQKVTLISYLYLDLQRYCSERNKVSLSALAPHQHRAQQGEKHIFFLSINSHDYSQRHTDQRRTQHATIAQLQFLHHV
jgi:hypothetical protein